MSTLALVNLLNQRWSELESNLLKVASFPSFKVFLSQYRGRQLPVKFENEAEQIKASSVGSDICAFFSKLFSDVFSNNADLTLSILNEFEEVLNLSLYYWCGSPNRNHQFRTIIHYCSLDGLGERLLPDAPFYISLSPTGIRFGDISDAHEPLVAPIYKVCNLNFWNADRFSQLNSDSVPQCVGQIRKIQREVCLLVDEWEHRNALLAVDQTEARIRLRGSPSEQAKLDYDQFFQFISLSRDKLAEWCLESFVAFQQWVSQNLNVNLKFDDVISELEALDCLLLSGIQKILLPASVSRHLYQKNVAALLYEWSVFRLLNHPDDVATQLSNMAFGAFSNPQKTSQDFEFPEYLLQKNHQWRLDFDPTAALKSFSWTYGRSFHVLMSLYAVVACFQKQITPQVESYWISNLASLIQMPETFQSQLPENLVNVDIDTEILEKSRAIFIDIWAKLKFSDGDKEICDFIYKNLVSIGKNT